MAVNTQLMEILVCPESHAPLVEEENWLVSRDPDTRRRYPVRDSIPIMLIEESETLDEETWREIMQRHPASE